MNGTIYTFYSYKGGVGRSMALSNIGTYFFRQGLTTLLIDWDLEAPGLERYFEERYRLDTRDVSDRPGLCDMLMKYMENVSQPAGADDGGLPCPPVEDYLYQLDHQNGASFWLMHAGRRAEGGPWEKYATFVQGFDWAAFYGEWEGGAYLEWLRARLKAAADIILIDSRTGVTEMGGVASQHLADAVVMFCGANLQNIENTARMAFNFASDAVRDARGGRPLDILVAPSRIDDADSEGFGEFIKRFDEAFSRLPAGRLEDGYDTKEMLLPYLAHFSYREKLIVGDPESETIASRLMDAYRAIAANMKLLAPDGSPLKTGRSETVHAAQSNVFVAYARDDETYARNIMTALSERGLFVRGGDQKRLKQEDVEAQFGPAHALVVLLTESSAKSKTFQKVVRRAEEMSKHIIPVILDDVVMPLWMAARKPLDFRSGFDESIIALAETVHALSSPAKTEETPKRPGKMIFISSSREDRAKATAVIDRLHADGFDTWTAEQNIMAGSDWVKEVEKALSECDALVVLVSSSSTSSRWIQQEVSYVMHSMDKPVIPLLVEKDVKLPLFLAYRTFIDVAQDFSRGLNELTQALRYSLKVAG